MSGNKPFLFSVNFYVYTLNNTQTQQTLLPPELFNPAGYIADVNQACKMFNI